MFGFKIRFHLNAEYELMNSYPTHDGKKLDFIENKYENSKVYTFPNYLEESLDHKPIIFEFNITNPMEHIGDGSLSITMMK